MIDLYRLFRPKFWIMTDKYSKSWDAFVLGAISRGDVRRNSDYTSYVGGRLVWTGNYPYAFGTPHCPSFNIRPSARTIDLLLEAIVLTDKIGKTP